MKSCDMSEEFGPRSPWTMSAIDMLRRTSHQDPDLKIWLKFEFEVLCDALRIELEDLKPKTYVIKNPEVIQQN